MARPHQALTQRFAKRLFLLSFLIMVVAGVWLLYVAVSVSTKAERNLHSTLFILQVVDEYVYENHRWPKSWAELEQLKFAGDAYSPRNGKLNVVRVGGAMKFSWPADSAILRTCVSVDFDANLKELVGRNAMQFDAIKPKGPCYEFRDYGVIESLQETVRSVLPTD